MMRHFMKLVLSWNLLLRVPLLLAFFYLMTGNAIAASLNGEPVCVADPCALTGGVGYRLNLAKKEMTVYNPTWYTGVLIQYTDFKDIMAVDFIGGTKTSWFAKKYTDPKQWINTSVNFGQQTRAIFSGNFGELGRLQSHITKVKIAQNTTYGEFVIGGVASLIFDLGTIIIDSIPENKSATVKIVKESLVEAYNNQARWQDIQTYVVQGEILKASSETLNMLFSILEKKLTPEMFKFLVKKLVERGFISIDALDDAVKKLNFISKALEGVQMVAKGIDAGLFNYYHADKKPLRTTDFSLANNLSCIAYQQGALLYQFPFSDVCVTDWYATYVLSGKEYGLIKGYPDKTFRPNQPVSRAEWLAMVVRLMEKRHGSWAGETVPLGAVPSERLKKAWYYEGEPILQKAYGYKGKNGESLAFWKESDISSADFWDAPIPREETAHVIANAWQIDTKEVIGTEIEIEIFVPLSPALYQDNYIFFSTDAVFPANRTISITEIGETAHINYPVKSIESNVVYSFLNTTIVNPSVPFIDVPFNSPNARWIYPVRKIGVIKGYSDGTFGYGEDLKRGEAAKILVNMAGL